MTSFHLVELAPGLWFCSCSLTRRPDLLGYLMVWSHRYWLDLCCSCFDKPKCLEKSLLYPGRVWVSVVMECGDTSGPINSISWDIAPHPVQLNVMISIVGLNGVWIPAPPGWAELHVKVSLSKILNSKFLLMCIWHLAWQPLPSVYECVCEWVNVTSIVKLSVDWESAM